MVEPLSLHVLQVVASLQGGAARHAVILSEGLKQNHHQVEIAAPRDNPALIEECRNRGIPLREVALSSRLPFSAVRQLRKLLTTGGYSHVHIHGHRAAALTRFACWSLKKTFALIYTLHGYHPRHYENPLNRWAADRIENRFQNLVDAFISVSADTQAEFLEAVPAARDRRRVIENGIPLRLLAHEERSRLREEHRRKLGIPANAFVIGTVTRLHRQKSVDRLLAAFPSVLENFPDPYLVIIGDGPERKKLEEQAKRLCLSDRCRFCGDRSDAISLYPLMDLFILPSLWEGLPLTILEAWDAGVPTAATKVSGTRNVIEDGITGFLGENTVAGIAQVMIRAVQNQEQFPMICENARKRLIQCYSSSRMVERIEQVYREVDFPE